MDFDLENTYKMTNLKDMIDQEEFETSDYDSYSQPPSDTIQTHEGIE